MSKYIFLMVTRFLQIATLVVVGLVLIYYPKAWRTINRIYRFANKIPQFTAIFVAICLAIGIKISNPFEPPINSDFEYVADETKSEDQPIQINQRNVSPTTKRLVGTRQNWRCAICGRQLDETFEVDHIIPLYKGGTNNMDNLVALDPICHRKKTRADRLGLKIVPVRRPTFE